MQRKKVAAAGIALAMVIAAACDDDDDSSETTAAESPETTSGDVDSSEEGDMSEEEVDDMAEEEQEEAEGSGEGEAVTLRWRTRPDNESEANAYAAVSDTIEGSSDSVSLEYEPGNSEGSPYQDQLVTEIANGTAPDVFWIPGTDIARFQQEGLILDLSDLAEADGFSTDEFYPEPMFHLTYDPETGGPGDVLWGLPRDVSTFAMYLNNDLIAEAGADDPRALAEAGEWDWDAFAEVAAAVSDLGGENTGFGMNSWWANYGYFINSAGGSFFNEDRTECALDTSEAIAGVTQMVDVYDQGLAVAWGEDAELPYNAGTVGMFINGRWATPGARENVDFNWDVVQLPTGPGGTQGNWLFWGAYVVNADTENPEAAWDLVRALTSAETQAQISELGANIPSLQSDAATDAFLTFTPPENNQAFLNGLNDSPTAEGPLWDGDWPRYDEVMGAAITSVVTGERSIDDYAANICSETAVAFE